MSTPAILRFDFQDPRESEVYKAATQITDSIKEFVETVDNHREQEIREGLTKFQSDFEEKQKEFSKHSQSLISTDARNKYLLERLYNHEQQMQAERLGPKVDAILNNADGNEAQIVKELSKILSSPSQIIAYLMNRAMFRWLEDYKTSHCNDELARPSSAVVESKDYGGHQQLAEPTLQKTNETSAALPQTKEEILKALQGLPPQQQLLNRNQLMIVLGIKKSTFSVLQKLATFPRPIRINGKGRGAMYILEEVLKFLTHSRQTCKFKPKL